MKHLKSLPNWLGYTIAAVVGFVIVRELALYASGGQSVGSGGLQGAFLGTAIYWFFIGRHRYREGRLQKWTNRLREKEEKAATENARNSPEWMSERHKDE